MDGPRSMPKDGRQIEYYIYIHMYHIINSTVMKHPENTNLQKGKLRVSRAGVDGGWKMTTNRHQEFLRVMNTFQTWILVMPVQPD